MAEIGFQLVPPGFPSDDKASSVKKTKEKNIGRVDKKRLSTMTEEEICEFAKEDGSFIDPSRPLVRRRDRVKADKV